MNSRSTHSSAISTSQSALTFIGRWMQRSRRKNAMHATIGQHVLLCERLESRCLMHGGPNDFDNGWSAPNSFSDQDSRPGFVSYGRALPNNRFTNDGETNAGTFDEAAFNSALIRQARKPLPPEAEPASLPPASGTSSGSELGSNQTSPSNTLPTGPRVGGNNSNPSAAPSEGLNGSRNGGGSDIGNPSNSSANLGNAQSSPLSGTGASSAPASTSGAGRPATGLNNTGSNSPGGRLSEFDASGASTSLGNGPAFGGLTGRTDSNFSNSSNLSTNLGLSPNLGLSTSHELSSAANSSGTINHSKASLNSDGSLSSSQLGQLSSQSIQRTNANSSDSTAANELSNARNWSNRNATVLDGNDSRDHVTAIGEDWSQDVALGELRDIAQRVAREHAAERKGNAGHRADDAWSAETQWRDAHSTAGGVIELANRDDRYDPTWVADSEAAVNINESSEYRSSLLASAPVFNEFDLAVVSISESIDAAILASDSDQAAHDLAKWIGPEVQANSSNESENPIDRVLNSASLPLSFLIVGGLLVANYKRNKLQRRKDELFGGDVM